MQGEFDASVEGVVREFEASLAGDHADGGEAQTFQGELLGTRLDIDVLQEALVAIDAIPKEGVVLAGVGGEGRIEAADRGAARGGER